MPPLRDRSTADNPLPVRPAPLVMRAMSRLLRAAFVALSCFGVCHVLPTTAQAQIEMPAPNLSDPIRIAADSASHWTEGSYDVWLLKGNCYINQGLAYARSHEAVLWIEHGDPTSSEPYKVLAYLDGEVGIHYDDRSDAKGAKPLANVADKTWYGRFQSVVEPDVRVGAMSPEPTVKPAVYTRAKAHRDPEPPGAIRRTQFTQAAGPGAAALPAPVESIPPGTRRIRAFTRSDVPVNAQVFPNQAANEWVVVINSGVNLIVDGLDNVGSLDVSADRIVIWTSGTQQPDLTGQAVQSNNQPLELYMEGNIFFRQGERIVRAQSMYYDVRLQRGIILNAEAMSPVPGYQGNIRIKADVLQQLDQNRFIAREGMFTTSRMGEPTYWIRGDTITYENQQQPVINPFTGAPEIDPVTGAPLVAHQQYVTSNNNVVFLEGVPVFYWPVLATNLERPEFYIQRAQFKHDSVFGYQVLTDWNLYQLLGIKNPPSGTEWSISLDYLSERGPAAGTQFKYSRPDFLGWGGPAKGQFDAWFVHDTGTDNLGLDRPSVPAEPEPANDLRGRVLFQHKQQLENNFVLTAEFGYITDRNFLQEYFRKEWEGEKDESTGIELKQYINNSSWAISADFRMNNFFMDTDQLPRLDHYWLGQPLFNDTLTWYEHSSAEYARLHEASAPTFPTDAATFTLLPYEANVQGERLITRQELDLPLQMGVVKVVPYALGELAHWGEDLAGESLDRVYGQVGIRASLPIWAAYPYVNDELFNLHGLAHKMTFDIDFSYSDANKDLTQLPLYDNIDDNEIESFRRRLAFQTFPPVPPVPPSTFIVPKQFDERFFALRSGIGDWVTSDVPEVADDLIAARLDLRQRWQTKRGPANDLRIVDWITLDTGIVLFPNPDRDNFGEVAGLANYDFRWNVGDRLTVLSDGLFDFFTDGEKEFTVGAVLTRPPRGTLALGFRSLEGPISSNVIHASYAYRMSPKWVSTAAISYDLSSTGNIGESFDVTRIGEAFLTTLGFSYDKSQNSFGVQFMFEPRFLPKTRLSRTSGLDIPLAGTQGLE